MSDIWPSEQDILAQVLQPLPPSLPLSAPVCIAWRNSGLLVLRNWYEADGLASALAQARLELQGRDADTLEICLTGNWHILPPEQRGQSLANQLRGRIGLELRHGETLHRIAPSQSIATNRPLLRDIEAIALQKAIPQGQLIAEAQISRFEAAQYLIDLPAQRAVRPYRAGALVHPADVTPQLLQTCIEDLSQWMLNNLQPDGRMTYKYWPSRGTQSQANNTIRQFMATVALGRIAARSGAAAHIDAARRNLAYNLGVFYRELDGLGGIFHDGSAKLGAMALAGLAILEFRTTALIAVDAYAAEFNGLCAGVAHLWQEDGAFRTFLTPAERNDNQNFYPGEALLFWASLHRSNRDPQLAQRCLKSFDYYSAWHRAQVNPAFIPWHSQAYVMLYQDLQADQRAADLAEFVFERNDWLLHMQQWSANLPKDFLGRFFNPARPDFGPPHASSTGVYMEGLADAWRLAQDMSAQHDDAPPRAAQYARALKRGLRAVRQLQFRDRLGDAFYISKLRCVMGGMRTESYNNEIRVDNVQHCLMALLKIEAAADFPWEPLQAP